MTQTLPDFRACPNSETNAVKWQAPYYLTDDNAVIATFEGFHRKINIAELFNTNRLKNGHFLIINFHGTKYQVQKNGEMGHFSDHVPSMQYIPEIDDDDWCFRVQSTTTCGSIIDPAPNILQMTAQDQNSNFSTGLSYQMVLTLFWAGWGWGLERPPQVFLCHCQRLQDRKFILGDFL